MRNPGMQKLVDSRVPRSQLEDWDHVILVGCNEAASYKNHQVIAMEFFPPPPISSLPDIGRGPSKISTMSLAKNEPNKGKHAPDLMNLPCSKQLLKIR